LKCSELLLESRSGSEGVRRGEEFPTESDPHEVLVFLFDLCDFIEDSHELMGFENGFDLSHEIESALQSLHYDTSVWQKGILDDRFMKEERERSVRRARTEWTPRESGRGEVVDDDRSVEAERTYEVVFQIGSELYERLRGGSDVEKEQAIHCSP
jgi:hypothetical protein